MFHESPLTSLDNSSNFFSSSALLVHPDPWELEDSPRLNPTKLGPSSMPQSLSALLCPHLWRATRKSISLVVGNHRPDMMNRTLQYRLHAASFQYVVTVQTLVISMGSRDLLGNSLSVVMYLVVVCRRLLQSLLVADRAYKTHSSLLFFACPSGEACLSSLVTRRVDHNVQTVLNGWSMVGECLKELAVRCNCC